MVSINNSSNKYQVSSTGISQAELQDKLNKSKQTVSDNFENNSVGKIIGGEDSSSKQKALLLVPPLMMADGLVDTFMGGTGNKSILKKTANIGDKISHALHLDKVLSEETGSRISNFIKNNRFLKYFTSDFKAVPRTSLARGSKMAEKYTSELVGHLSSIANNPEFGEVVASLSEESAKTLQAAADSVKSSGLSASHILKAADELISKGVDKIQAGGLTKKQASISSVRNKLAAATSKMGETALGKGAAKGLLKTKDIFTYGGGALSLYFTASALVNAFKAAKEAPKGEKKSTFMHVLSEQYLGIILFQPSISIMYKLGGNKYRGMTVEGREALKNLVKSTNTNAALTKEGLKVAKMQRDLLIKGVNKDKVAELAGKTLKEAKEMAKGLKKEGAKLKFWEKPLKLMGKILDTGLDKMQKPTFINLKKKLPLIGDKIKVPKPTVKGFAGGLARFAIIMFLIQPLLQKPLTKLSHKIFGEPKTYLAKQAEKNGAKKEEKPSDATPVYNPNETNLIKRWTQLPEGVLPEQQNNNPSNAQQPISPVAASKISDDNKTEENPSAALNLFNRQPKRYIPTVEPPVIEDNSKEIEKRVKTILNNTDKILKESKKYL